MDYIMKTPETNVMSRTIKMFNRFLSYLFFSIVGSLRLHLQSSALRCVAERKSYILSEPIKEASGDRRWSQCFDQLTATQDEQCQRASSFCTAYNQIYYNHSRTVHGKAEMYSLVDQIWLNGFPQV